MFGRYEDLAMVRRTPITHTFCHLGDLEKKEVKLIASTFFAEELY
jgi:hypothetical protein